MEEWYYTRGGQQQGPVNLETLRDMAAADELKPEDMVWNKTMTDWVPSSEVDGIHSSTSPNTAPDAPTPPPLNGGNAPELEEIEPGSDPVDAGACISRGFQLTKTHFVPLLGILVIYTVIGLFTNGILTAVDVGTGMGGTQTINLFGQTITQHKPSLLHQLISNLVSIYLSLGMLRIALNVVDGKPFTLGQLFSCGPQLITGFLASLIFVVMVLAGALLFIVPGIYLAIRFGPYLTVIADKNLAVFDSLSYASRLTTNSRLNLFVLGIFSILVMIAGFLALIVGLFFAYPVVLLAWAVSYRWMQYGRRVAE